MFMCQLDEGIIFVKGSNLPRRRRPRSQCWNLLVEVLTEFRQAHLACYSIEGQKRPYESLSARSSEYDWGATR